ncbi:3-hydroxyacyl-CoA dehydrogenase NAD-binding domain-containing protein [Ponticaulis sp.]|uniref:3-hydroxyacyl-CoA dehydrogenase NAD-binding domain-containing protein n=1 Tax=Ponticaulis sp. TaxID=2020902 RepID=UPI000B6D4A3E|nr:3-hydroxyacyl-CoA dehydrogenase NAD-binding domain-containing protein [Ponticaulis sp.]MAI91682.1 3-hydroxyacyl-CoA dehydrogenase [Ponticaulis sp.]OUX96945.1 MAG: 3-hydroxyacyl-CoA dehydrogenase [Hyphomonadaceae bacterium TMED5]|tara:strand:- start:10160 stop:12217 length:2058 start_codon:yes stop_codon:yes gene_type:complete
MSVISTHKDGDVLVIVSNNPPVNALGQAVRAGLQAGIEEALADDSVKAVVIRCDGRTFFAGADITEFGKPPVAPSLPDVIEAIEACTKPVVAAIHGTALGGGLEVALGAHYRIAVPSAQVGLPEVKLGILPGAGGTQRLPRVVGVPEALSMIVTGNPIKAAKAESIGLIDKIVDEGTLEAEAIAFAKSVIGTTDIPRTSERTDKIKEAVADPSVFSTFMEKNGRKLAGYQAPIACIEAVKAAVNLPIKEGLAKERELFMKLVSGTQSAALRHVFFAERAASKIDDIPKDTPLIDIKTVGILGAGTMGGGIAMNFLSAGIPVTILEREQAALDRGVSIIRKNYENTAKRGRMTMEQVEQAMSLLSTTLDMSDLSECDLIIEAVFELMSIKKDVFTNLDKTIKKGAILASNTSYLNVDEIAACTSRPEDVIGLHFFSPANIMKLLEIVRGEKTSDTVLATSMALAKKIRKVAVVSGVCPGFIGNRILAKRQEQAQQMILEGAKPWDVDRVLTDFGLPMGPFQMADLAGVDIGWDPEKTSSSTVREVLCERGRKGQKTGKGFYDYDDARRGSPSPETEEIIADFMAKAGTTPREISDQEILERCLYPMVNEGAKILEEGMAQRASDIDVVWMNGYGWPPYTGGPMFWGDTVGLDVILAGLEKHADAFGDKVTISPLLREKAAKGETFN